MFEQSELQGTQMAPNGPPNATKGTALIAPEIANYRKPGLLGHFCHFLVVAKTAILEREKLNKRSGLVILASYFRARVDTPTKSPTWGLA